MKEKLNKNISELLTGLQTGEMQVHNSMAVFPLLSKHSAFEGMTGLDEAFEKKCIEFKEVSKSGSVPNLLAINKCKHKVLILEGQELKGAKQNRTLNTHILLAENSETVIPVSCTEQGRWSYKKTHFDLTDKLVSHNLRRKINMSVKDGLKFDKAFISNQAEVWDEIESYMISFDKFNPTSSYDDFFEEIKVDLRDYEGKFPVLENQVGVVVFIDGKLEGVEFVNDTKIYKQNHDKIIKSYMIDDFKIYTGKRKKKSGKFELADLDYTAREGEMKAIIDKFFKEVIVSYYTIHKSPGLGSEYRLTESEVEGNILVFEEKPLVAHLFPKETTNQNNNVNIKKFYDKIRFRGEIRDEIRYKMETILDLIERLRQLNRYETISNKDQIDHILSELHFLMIDILDALNS